MFGSKRCIRHLFLFSSSLLQQQHGTKKTTALAFVSFPPILLHHKHSFSTTTTTTTTTPPLPIQGNMASNQNDNDKAADGMNGSQELKPSTGWNHNMPSESSNFWKPIGDGTDDDNNNNNNNNNDAKTSTYTPPYVPPSPTRDETNSNSNSNSKEEEPRTGWLHNTSPKSYSSSSSSPENKNKPKESAAVKMLRLEKYKRRKNHRIISPPALHCCGNNRRIVVTEHLISVPVQRTSSSTSSSSWSPSCDYTDDANNNNNNQKQQPKMLDVYFTITELIQNESDEYFFTTTLSPTRNPDHPTMQDCAELYVKRCNLQNANDCILYLQGGPGFGCAAPMVGIGLGEKSSWASEALGGGFKRVVLMDQRGTGRSTPITKQTLQHRFPDLFALDDHVATAQATMKFASSLGSKKTSSSSSKDSLSIAEQLDEWSEVQPDLAANVGVALGHAVEYMSNFRADNIVRDAEAVKEALLVSSSSAAAGGFLNSLEGAGAGGDDEEETPKPWGAAIGQSFGGFCMMTYLSQIAHPPKICLLTGGIAPMLTPVYDVYNSLWNRVKERNLRYYDQYPGDITLVKRIVRRLLSENEPPVVLPSGGVLTARRFLQLGISFGSSPSAFASFHSLLASAIVADGGGISEEEDESIEFTKSFLKRIDSEQPFDDAPIYFLLHESIYADGPSSHSTPTDWAADRVRMDRTKTPNEFSYELTSKLNSDARPTLFFGEMVFPWMADGDFAEVSGFGMKALAHSLAAKDDWGPLYDADAMRRALADGGSSKAAAAVYYDDMYVDFDACMKVASRGGPLEKCKVWITNDYQHSGLRDNGAEIFTKLMGMAKGSIRTPS